MTVAVFQSILYPTDFSNASIPAFAHALRIAVAAKSKLHLLNVSRHMASDDSSRSVPTDRRDSDQMGHAAAARANKGAWPAIWGCA